MWISSTGQLRSRDVGQNQNQNQGWAGVDTSQSYTPGPLPSYLPGRAIAKSLGRRLTWGYADARGGVGQVRPCGDHGVADNHDSEGPHLLMSSSLIDAVRTHLPADLALDGEYQRDLVAALGAVPDPRARRGVRYRLASLLAVAVCAVLAGACTFAAIADWAADLCRASEFLAKGFWGPDTKELIMSRPRCSRSRTSCASCSACCPAR